MAQHKKIQLKRRSGPSARIHRGLSMPVGPGSDNSTVSFRSLAELKAKYFVMTGRLSRHPFIMRTLILMVAQFMFSIILYSRIVEAILVRKPEFAVIFGIIFILLTIPVVWSQISLGVRRCHDMNRQGAFFIIPFFCYLASYIAPVLGWSTVADVVQGLAAVFYLALFFIKGNGTDNVYGSVRPR